MFPLYLNFNTEVNFLGRIKTKLIKRITEELFAKYSDRFTTNYAENKKALNLLIMAQSKKIKNAIAGYLTRLKKAVVR